MRAGWTPKLQSLLWAADPVVKLIAEVVRTIASDIKDTRAEWAAADSGTGLEFLLSGGARLFATATGDVTQATDDGTQITAIGPDTPYSIVAIEWTAPTAEDRELHNLVLRLDPQADGGQAVEVTHWQARVCRIAEKIDDRVVLEPRSAWIEVQASGTTPQDVTFNFGSGDQYPTVGPAPSPGDNLHPVTVIQLRAIKATGDAGNVAWLADSTLGNEVIDTGFILRHYEADFLVGQEEEEVGGELIYVATPTTTGMPRFTLNRASYTAATATFSLAGNRIDLGAVPTGDVEVVASGQTPDDSSITYEIHDGVSWVGVVDGDILGQDNTSRGGSDLTSMPIQQTYDVRATLTPSTSGLRTPTVRRLGLREIETTDLTGVCDVRDAVWRVEPQTLKGEITRANVHILKTGERDYRDYGSEILAQYHIGEIEVRVWVGDPSGLHLSRHEWMHIDSFEIEDYTNDNTAHVLACVSPLRRLRKTVPPFVQTGPGTGTRTAEEYLNVTITAAFADLRDNLGALPARYRGQPVEDATLVSKTLYEADLKDELDRLAYLAGMGLITSQGRIKAVSMMRDGPGADTPVATFYIGDYQPLVIGPGYGIRTDEFFVPWGWNEAAGTFTDEHRKINATAVEKLGGRGLQSYQRLDDETAKWVANGAHAATLADRVVRHFANGLILWELRPIYRHPHLEPGDPVVVITDRFVGRSPSSDQEVRGTVAALGVVSRASGIWGEQFSVWIPSFDQLAPAEDAVTRSGFARSQFIVPLIIASATISGNKVIPRLEERDPQDRLIDARYKVGVEGGDFDWTDPTDGSWSDADTIEV